MTPIKYGWGANGRSTAPVKRPLRTGVEMAEEFSVPAATLRAALKDAGAPLPVWTKSRCAPYYDPVEMRRWWAARI